MLADLTKVILGLAVGPGTVTVELAVTLVPDGAVPVAVPVLERDPASTSAWVVVYVAVHVSDAPGARVLLGQEMAERPVMGSVTATEVRVTLPLLVTL
jgi:hypothetical protein